LALLNLYKDQSVPQSDSYAISEGSCEYEIVQLSGGYEISAVVTDSETNTDSELVVEISISNFLEVESWQ